VIVAIHQPQYLPWLGYIGKIIEADVFCYLDNVQFKKNEWQNRNRIKTVNGPQWVTVPVKYRFPEKINEVTINNTINWQQKHLNALTTNYSKAPYFKAYMEEIMPVYKKQWSSISDLNINLIETIKHIMGIKKKSVKSSEMNLSNDPTGRLIDICRKFDCTTYLAGAGAENYMDFERFRREGIIVKVQQFSHPEYTQPFGRFTSHLTVLDLLFNCGPESLEKIEDGIN